MVNDDPLDDREAGIVSLGEDQLQLSWFSANTRSSSDHLWAQAGAGCRERWSAGYARMDFVSTEEFADSWMCLSADGGTRWDRPWRLMLTASHGTIALQSNNLLFLGKHVSSMESFARGEGAVVSISSTDGRRTRR